MFSNEQLQKQTGLSDERLQAAKQGQRQSGGLRSLLTKEKKEKKVQWRSLRNLFQRSLQSNASSNKKGNSPGREIGDRRGESHNPTPRVVEFGNNNSGARKTRTGSILRNGNVRRYSGSQGGYPPSPAAYGNHYSNSRCCGNMARQHNQSWCDYLFFSCCNVCGRHRLGRNSMHSRQYSSSALSTYSFSPYQSYESGQIKRLKMKLLIHSRVWQILSVAFMIVLLFGPQVRDLWSPKTYDILWDVIFILCIVFLCTDVLLRCFVIPSYFPFQVGKKRIDGSVGTAATNTATIASQSVMAGSVGASVAASGPGERKATDGRSANDSNTKFVFKIGSFVFWCDLISTLTLVRDLSLIYYWTNELQTMDIVVGPLPYSIPVR